MNELFSEECKLLGWGDTSDDGVYVQIGLPWDTSGMVREVLADEKSIYGRMAIIDPETGEVIYQDDAWVFKCGGKLAPWVKVRVSSLDPFRGLQDRMLDIVVRKHE